MQALRIPRFLLIPAALSFVCSAAPQLNTALVRMLPFNCAEAGVAWAEGPYQVRHQGIELSISPTGSPAGQGLEIRIAHPQLQPAQLGLLLLENPARFVIDLPRVKTTSNLSQKVTPSSAIGTKVSTIRLGTHPEKTRIVLDLRDPKLSKFSSKVEGGTAVVQLTSAQPVVTEQEQAPIGEVAKESATPSPRETRQPLASPASSASLVASPTPTQAGAPSPAASQAIVSKSSTPQATGTPLAPSPKPSIPKPGNPSTAQSPSESAIVQATEVQKPSVSLAPSIKPSVTTTVSPTVAPSFQRTPAQAAASRAASLSPSAAPTIVPGTPHLPSTPVATGTPPASTSSVVVAPGTGLLSAIDFDFAPPDRISVLRFSLGVRSQFRLSKKNEREYSLTIPRAVLAGSHLGLPLFPPRDFVGINMVVVRSLGDSLEASILVERGVKVRAFAKDQEVWVMPLNR
jgi:hypothetical protein